MSAFSISEDAAMSVKELALVSDEEGIYLPLKTVTVNMAVDAPCTCSCVPIIGKEGWKHFSSSPSVLERIHSGMLLDVYMVLRDRGKIGNNDPFIFSGRVMANELNVSSSPFSSVSDAGITLQHAAQADLGGVSVGERSYYQGIEGSRVAPFTMRPESNSTLLTDKLMNGTLEEGKIGVYLKEFCTMLVKWYTAGKVDFDMDAILKAVPFKVREEIAKMVKGNATGKAEGIPVTFAMSVASAFNASLASRANLLSILSTLCSYALLSLVPTADSLVISPRLDVTKWTKDTGVYIPRNWMTSISSNTTFRRFPVDAVCLNKRFSGMYILTDGSNMSMNGLPVWNDRFRYPENESGDGVIIVDPPRILVNVLNNAGRTAGERTPPKPIDEGGEGDDRNSVGAEPVKPPDTAAIELGKIAARLMWSKLAYSHRSTRIGLLPHWVFGRSFDDELHDDLNYCYNLPWSLLGRNVMFKMPYAPNDTAKEVDVPYVGYVKGMNLNVSLEGPSLFVGATLTNVRTSEEDKAHSLPWNVNPLYDDIDAKPV